MQESGYANHSKLTLITATSSHHVKPGRVRSYERNGLSFVEVELPGISAADITLSLQDDRLTLYALNNLGRIAYEWETYILPTIPVSLIAPKAYCITQGAIDSQTRNFQCGMKRCILGISWLNWGSGEDTSPQQIQSLEISSKLRIHV